MKPCLLCLLPLIAVAACVEAPEERPMDEVPQRQTLANGHREYGFANGCVITLQPKRAVVISEAGPCALYHRDIALLYASAD